MKKTLTLLLIAFGMSVTTAQTTTQQKKESTKIIITKAPKQVNNKFAGEYPGIKPVWTLEDNNYTATYTNEDTGLNHFVVYSKDGQLLSKESEMGYKEYPSITNQYYSQRFPEEKFRIIKCEAPNGEIYYFAKHRAKIIKFDTTGKFIPDKSEKIKLSGLRKVF